MLRKIFLGVVALGFLGAIAVVVLVSNLDTVVREAVSRVGEMAGVDMAIADVDVDIRAGQARLGGFTVANPQGYSPANALSLGALDLAIDMGASSTDKIVVSSLVIDSAAALYEVSRDGSSNLADLLTKFESLSSGKGQAEASPSSTPEGSDVMLIIDQLEIRDPSLSLGVVGLDQDITINPGSLVLTNIGRAADSSVSADAVMNTGHGHAGDTGVRPATLLATVLDALLEQAQTAMKSQGLGLIKNPATLETLGDTMEDQGEALMDGAQKGLGATMESMGDSIESAGESLKGGLKGLTGGE